MMVVLVVSVDHDRHPARLIKFPGTDTWSVGTLKRGSHAFCIRACLKVRRVMWRPSCQDATILMLTISIERPNSTPTHLSQWYAQCERRLSR